MTATHTPRLTFLLQSSPQLLYWTEFGWVEATGVPKLTVMFMEAAIRLLFVCLVCWLSLQLLIISLMLRMVNCQLIRCFFMCRHVLGNASCYEAFSHCCCTNCPAGTKNRWTELNPNITLKTCHLWAIHLIPAKLPTSPGCQFLVS